MSTDEDDRLLLAAGAGDREAFQALVARHLEWSWRLAHRLAGGREADAADLVQDGWVRLLEKAADYRPQGRFRAFLRTVLSRLWLDQVKRRRPELRPDPPEVPASAVPAADALAGAEAEARIWRAVAALPESQRLALTLRVQAGASYDEIAALLGTSRKGVEMHLRRARLALRSRGPREA